MYTIFNREPFTPWKIAIIDRYIDITMEEIEAEDSNGSDYEEFTCYYRTALQDGKECERFVMILKETDYAVFQMNIFKNGNINYYSQMPISVETNRINKRIEILPLVYCKVDKEKQTIDYEPIEQ